MEIGLGAGVMGLLVSAAFLVESAWEKADSEQARMTIDIETFLSKKMFLGIADGFG